MILILSQSGYEPTTELVMEWLHSMEASFVRVNADDLWRSRNLTIQLSGEGLDAHLDLDGQPITMQDVSAVWYRRWRRDKEPDCFEAFVPEEQNYFNVSEYRSHVAHEFRTVSGAFFSLFSKANWLGRYSTYRLLNKLVVLQTAARVGLDIPRTLVTTSSRQAISFEEKCGNLIVKPLSDLLLTSRNSRLYMSYTDVPNLDSTRGGWKGGFPSLFQEKLSKRYELRCFYLDGQCYTMATIPGHGNEEQTDWRWLQYTDSVTVRRVPYELPAEIQNKIARLMDELELDTGSLDLVRTADGSFVFLEVNPVGQFGMVSAPCNYQLEEKVARALIRRAQANGSETGQNITS